MEISKLGNLTSLLKSSGSGANAGEGTSFADMLKNMVSQTVDSQKQVESLTTAAANGADVPLNEVVQAISKAELTLQTMVTVRDKAVEAYQEIIRMPI